MVYQTIVIGAGPAGLAAALYTGRGGLKTLLFSGSLPGGQALQTVAVDNYPGSPLNFTGPALINNLTAQVKSFDVPLLSETVMAVKKIPSATTNLFAVVTEKNTYQTQTIIIATGATRSKLGLAGESELIGKGLSFCATCDGPFFRDREVAVIGGGSAALDEALFLTNFASCVHLIHRRAEFRAPDVRQINQIQNHPQIKTHLQNQVVNYLTDERGRLQGLTLIASANSENNDSRLEPKPFNLPVSGVFLAIGTQPNSELFQHLPDLQFDSYGYIKTSSTSAGFSTMTHLPGVFAAGDVTDPLYKQLIVAAGTGAQAALDVQHYLMVK